MKPTYEQLQEQLENAKREFRSADITMQNLEAQCAALAADNDKAMESMRQADAVVKLAHEKYAEMAAEIEALREYRPQPSGAAMMEALDAFYEHDDVPERGMMAAFEILCCKRPKTPATDAFLAEVRAQARNHLIDELEVWFTELSQTSTTPELRSGAAGAAAFISTFRKGVQS